MDTMISNYTNLVPNLERQELESSVQGSTSPQVYGQLLAIYLLINDLPNAKLLWKRIPADVKEANSDLQAIWAVGVKLFQRDLHEVYGLVDQVEWPGHLKNIMNCIKVSTQERVISLIAKAYSSIRMKELAILVGYTEEETVAKAAALGWRFEAESGYIFPTKTSPTDETASGSFDQLMTKLTEYVAFLEN